MRVSNKTDQFQITQVKPIHLKRQRALKPVSLAVLMSMGVFATTQVAISSEQMPLPSEMTAIQPATITVSVTENTMVNNPTVNSSATSISSVQNSIQNSAPNINLSTVNQPININSIKVPNIEEFYTSSGTRVLFSPTNQLPIVDVKIIFNAGSARDNSLNKPVAGLASLTARMLDEGTSKLTEDQIAEKFENLAVQYNAEAFRDMFVIDLRSQSDPKIYQPAVDQLVDMLADAQFPQKNLDRIKENLYTGQKQREESPNAVANLRFWRELYQQHPYAEPSNGTIESIKPITREDLKQFKDQFLVAKNANIAITGDLTLKQAKKLAEQITSSLKTGEKAPPLVAPTPIAQNKVVKIPYKSTQTHVMLGSLGVTRDGTDLASIQVGNEILGGGTFNARLMEELREKRGLTYGAYSQLSPMQANGPFIVAFSTRNDQAEQAIKTANDTLENFAKTPLSAEEVEKAKQGILKRYAGQYSNNQALNDQLGMIGFYGYPTNYLQQHIQKIAQVDSSSINKALYKILTQPKITVQAGS